MVLLVLLVVVVVVTVPGTRAGSRWTRVRPAQSMAAPWPTRVASAAPPTPQARPKISTGSNTRLTTLASNVNCSGVLVSFSPRKIPWHARSNVVATAPHPRTRRKRIAKCRNDDVPEVDVVVTVVVVTGSMMAAYGT